MSGYVSFTKFSHTCSVKSGENYKKWTVGLEKTGVVFLKIKFRGIIYTWVLDLKKVKCYYYSELFCWLALRSHSLLFSSFMLQKRYAILIVFHLFFFFFLRPRQES